MRRTCSRSLLSRYLKETQTCTCYNVSNVHLFLLVLFFIYIQKQLADVEKEVHDYEQRYLSLSDRKVPCETRLVAAKELDDECKEGIQRLDALRTEVELRFIQDPAVSIPPELFSLRHHLIDLHDKVRTSRTVLP